MRQQPRARKCVVDLGAAFVADEQPFELVQPGEGALDDPAVAAESGAVLGLAARDQRFDAALADEAAVFVVVVAAVGDHRVGSPAGPADAPRDRRDPSSSGISWVTSLRLPPVTEKASGIPSRRRGDGAWSRDGPCRPGSGPFRSPLFRLDLARVDDRATTRSRRQPASRVSNSACSRSHTPARCHSSSRRQQVTPEPKPSSNGRCRQAIPVCNTNRIPCSACRSGRRLRPGYRNRRPCIGNSGSTSSHNSSDTTHGAHSHRHPSQLDDRCRRHSSSANGSLHSAMSSPRSSGLVATLVGGAALLALGYWVR